MKAIILPEYNSNVIRALKSLHVEETEIPKPAGRNVLVKVTASPCNPSDIAFMRGSYNIRKPVPAVMGFECTGTVVETGDHPEAKALLGKRVSCFSQSDENGTWAEYFLTDYNNCLTIKDDLDDDQASGLCINPFTAYALFSMALGRKANAIIQNGSSGQIGIFIRTLARRNRIPVINLVRKEEHIRNLHDSGEKYVLSMNDPDFESNLAAIAREVRATIAFDAVGGDISGTMINAMPPGSELVVYGGLSGKPIGLVNPLEIIFKSKSIRGFNLGDWKIEIGSKRFQEISDELQQLMVSRILVTRIQCAFSLEEVHQALEQYIRNMSSGKIIFQP
ncbi:MAG: zinc-binding dehydrogenase [Bacteroidales bacterium]|jgi:NADPH:quinone reductase-like Zn-dependent oxidoreductase|nr:zinc-binding dehydrogenase [Bacteroidales bacterium]